MSQSHERTGKCWCGGSHSRIGAYLEDLADQAPPPAVAMQRCEACGNRMDPKLIAKTGWKKHPNCMGEDE